VLERLDRRELLATMAIDPVIGGGITGIAGGGSVWHFQDNSGWTSYGGAGVVSLIYAYTSTVQPTVFAQTGNGEVYERVNGLWHDTGGALLVGSMVADQGLLAGVSGITGIAGGGSVWHYQDNRGWTSYGGAGVVSLVDAVDPAAPRDEDLYAQVFNGTVYELGTGAWINTGGALVVGSMVADPVNGVTGVAGGGSVWHFRNGHGWSSDGGAGVVALVDTFSGFGYEIFAQVFNGVVYKLVNGVWVSTGGALYGGTMTASGSGIIGIAGGGSVWHYQDAGGWSGFGGAVFVSDAGVQGQNEFYAQTSNGELYSTAPGQGFWHVSNGAFVLPGTVAPPSPPVSPPPPPTLPPPPFSPPPPPSTGLSSAYNGVIQDFASDFDGDTALIQNEGPHNIYLSNIHAYSDAEGDNVAGNLAIVNWAGDNISVPFVGSFFTDGTPFQLDIGNAPDTAEGGVFFTFNFELTSSGQLYCSHALLVNDFDVEDERNDFFDDDAPNTTTYYVLMNPNPNGLP
jgi:hypothetical protein